MTLMLEEQVSASPGQGRQPWAGARGQQTPEPLDHRGHTAHRSKVKESATCSVLSDSA